MKPQQTRNILPGLAVGGLRELRGAPVVQPSGRLVSADVGEQAVEVEELLDTCLSGLQHPEVLAVDTDLQPGGMGLASGARGGRLGNVCLLGNVFNQLGFVHETFPPKYNENQRDFARMSGKDFCR